MTFPNAHISTLSATRYFCKYLCIYLTPLKYECVEYLLSYHCHMQNTRKFLTIVLEFFFVTNFFKWIIFRSILFKTQLVNILLFCLLIFFVFLYTFSVSVMVKKSIIVSVPKIYDHIYTQRTKHSQANAQTNMDILYGFL